MFELREPTKTPEELARVDRPSTEVMDGTMPTVSGDDDGDTARRHRTLIDILNDEGERQAEERYQMAIDEDYNDHLQWRPEDAAVLMERGQAPLVFNEGRQTIEWISGTEKRMRKDYKVLPREPDDEAGAELKTKLIKYTDDVNMTQWHRSKAFKQMAVAGLSWLEEGINSNPEEEIIYSGSDDWRNVLRDSRSRDLLQRDARYLFRKKRLDLDFAQALLKNVAKDRVHLLRNEAYRNGEEPDEQDAPWYLGQKLTGASDVGGSWRRATSFDERSAFMQSNGYYDSGRRLSVDLIECWYRVPEDVQVFVGGMFDGKIYNDADPRMLYAVKREGAMLRDAVRMRMRVMLATPDFWFWDGPSPYRHGQFLLTPLYAYRRARDGMAYGVWRGMRDLSDDTNKRRSKALWSLSVNRVVADEGAIPEDGDIDSIRREAARPDGVIIKRKGADVKFEPHVMDFQGNLELARENTQIMRNVGGVTNENLGQNTSAQSGKAILAKQDQGSLTTSDLFDNYLLAIKQAGKIRLSHMEQFWTGRKAVRIVGGRRPIEWAVINEFDPETGEFKNDITQRQADFEVDTQDYRSSLAQAALEQMFALLGQIATFAPQVVLSVLDLVVESADIKDKEEWINRIRKLNGQRDPSKKPTPAEEAQEMQANEKQQKADALVELLGEAELKLKQATASKTEAETTLKTVEAVLKRVSAMGMAVDTAAVVTTVPHVVQAADAITQAAGLDDLAVPPGAAAMAAAPAAPAQEMPPPNLAAQQQPAPELAQPPASADAPPIDPTASI
jgi:hypothetical protein